MDHVSPTTLPGGLFCHSYARTCYYQCLCQLFLSSLVTTTQNAMPNAWNRVIWVARNSPSSLAMSSLDRAHTTSYSTWIKTVSILHHCWVIASYLSKVADFNLHHRHLAPQLRGTHSNSQRVSVALLAWS